MSYSRELYHLINTANKLLDLPSQPYVGGVHQVGNIHLAGAYGGWKVDQITEGGGTKDLFDTGFIPKSQLVAILRGYVKGIVDAKNRSSSHE